MGFLLRDFSFAMKAFSTEVRELEQPTNKTVIICKISRKLWKFCKTHCSAKPCTPHFNIVCNKAGMNYFFPQAVIDKTTHMIPGRNVSVNDLFLIIYRRLNGHKPFYGHEQIIYRNFSTRDVHAQINRTFKVLRALRVHFASVSFCLYVSLASYYLKVWNSLFFASLTENKHAI